MERAANKPINAIKWQWCSYFHGNLCLFRVTCSREAHHRMCSCAHVLYKRMYICVLVSACSIRWYAKVLQFYGEKFCVAQSLLFSCTLRRKCFRFTFFFCCCVTFGKGERVYAYMWVDEIAYCLNFLNAFALTKNFSSFSQKIPRFISLISRFINSLFAVRVRLCGPLVSHRARIA